MTDDRKDQNPFARSIDDLFSGESPPSAPDSGEPEPEEPEILVPDSGEPGPGLEEPFSGPVIIEDDAPGAVEQPAPGEVTWVEVPDDPPESAPSVDADPDALASALDRFLRSPPLERGGQASEIRELVNALKAANALDPLANAVERLVTEAADDEASLALADFMVTAGVASRIVARLGAERDEERKARLLEVCKQVGLEMAMAVSDALSDTEDRFARRAFMEAMVHLGATGMVVIEQMIDDPRWFVVRNAVAVLGDVGGDRAVELITSTLAHTNPRVRREALLALAKVGGEDAGLLVHGMLEDSDPEVRLAAAMAAGELKVERALRPLLAILEDESDQDVTIGVLRALGKLGDPGAVHSIEKHAVPSFFSKPATDVRIAAYRALHNIGTPHARRLLNQAVDDKEPQVKASVREMLGIR